MEEENTNLWVRPKQPEQEAALEGQHLSIQIHSSYSGICSLVEPDFSMSASLQIPCNHTVDFNLQKDLAMTNTCQ